MDLQSMAMDLVKQQLGSVDEGAVSSAVSSLLGGGDKLDGLIEQLSGGGLSSALTSWLGDGDNEAIDANALTSALGTDKVAAFASQLGIDTDSAATSLSNVLPALIDKNSSGGNLLGGVAGLASKLFD